MEGVVAVAGVLALIGGIVWWSIWMEKKRVEKWKAVAPTLGLEYRGEDRNFDSRHGTFKLFTRGHSRRAATLLTGYTGRTSVELADYRWTTGSGKHAQHHRRVVCVLRTDNLNLPHFYLRPQGFFDSLGKLFGGQDIDFAEDPRFSKAFVLQGESEAAIRSRFDRRIRDWLTAHSKLDLEVEGKGNEIVFCGARAADPEHARGVMDLTLEFMMLFV